MVSLFARKVGRLLRVLCGVQINRLPQFASESLSYPGPRTLTSKSVRIEILIWRFLDIKGRLSFAVDLTVVVT